MSDWILDPNVIDKYHLTVSGLFGLQEILRIFKSDGYTASVKIRQLQDILNTHEDLRALDRIEEQDNVTEKYIVINLSNESVYLNVMRQVSLLRSYILSTKAKNMMKIYKLLSL